MPPKKRRNINCGSDNELSGNESEISNSSHENTQHHYSSEDEHPEHETDDSSDMDIEECENRRKELGKDIQELEIQFNILRERIYTERIEQVKKQIAELQAGTSSQYVTQLNLLEEEKRSRIEVAGVLRDVRMDTLKNQYEAEITAALQNFENDKKLAQDTIYNELMNTIKQLEEDKRNSEIAWGEGGKWAAKKGATPRAKKAVTVSGPYIVYMLKPEEIMEDWTTIRKACQNT
ncbi:hypothetical protein YQE_09171, partial [Dendroctonus ponderosae]